MPFTDVAPTSWYYSAVLAEYQVGLFKDIETLEFLPDKAVTRGEFVTLLYRLEKEPKISEKVDLKDIKAGARDYVAVCWAAEKGIVTGSNGYFKPDKALTREDMTMILYRYAQYKGFDVKAGSDFNLVRYSDSRTISNYAKSAVKWACNAGILSIVSESSLDPKGKPTRAQTAVVIYWFLNRPEE